MTRIVRVWKLLNAPCREMSRLASESLDRDLDRVEKIAMRSHQVYCRGCRRYLRQIVRIREAVRTLAGRIETAPGPVIPDDVRARIKQAIRDELSAS